MCWLVLLLLTVGCTKHHNERQAPQLRQPALQLASTKAGEAEGADRVTGWEPTNPLLGSGQVGVANVYCGSAYVDGWSEERQGATAQLFPEQGERSVVGDGSIVSLNGEWWFVELVFGCDDERGGVIVRRPQVVRSNKDLTVALDSQSQGELFIVLGMLVWVEFVNKGGERDPRQDQFDVRLDDQTQLDLWLPQGVKLGDQYRAEQVRVLARLIDPIAEAQGPSAIQTTDTKVVALKELLTHVEPPTSGTLAK